MNAHQYSFLGLCLITHVYLFGSPLSFDGNIFTIPIYVVKYIYIVMAIFTADFPIYLYTQQLWITEDLQATIMIYMLFIVLLIPASWNIAKISSQFARGTLNVMRYAYQNTTHVNYGVRIYIFALCINTLLQKSTIQIISLLMGTPYFLLKIPERTWGILWIGILIMSIVFGSFCKKQLLKRLLTYTLLISIFLDFLYRITLYIQHLHTTLNFLPLISICVIFTSGIYGFFYTIHNASTIT